MEGSLEIIGLSSLIMRFEEEKISPDLVPKLSKVDMQYLGIAERSDMMRLRMECINYGSNLPVKRNSEFLIPEDVLDFLFESKFKISEISQMFNVSESTIYRRMRQCNISVTNYDEILDDDLDQTVSEISMWRNNGPRNSSSKICTGMQ